MQEKKYETYQAYRLTDSNSIFWIIKFELE